MLGIGGFFFRARNPKLLGRWYRELLGVNETPPDHAQAYWVQQRGPTVFRPFAQGTEYFGDQKYSFMLNFQVTSLAAMVAQLQAAGIAIDVDANEYPIRQVRAISRCGRQSSGHLATE